MPWWYNPIEIPIYAHIGLGILEVIFLASAFWYQFQVTQPDVQTSIGLFWTCGFLIICHVILIVAPWYIEEQLEVEHFEVHLDHLPEYANHALADKKLPKWFSIMLPSHISAGDNDSENAANFCETVQISPLVWCCVILNLCILVIVVFFVPALVVEVIWNLDASRLCPNCN